MYSAHKSIGAAFVLIVVACNSTSNAVAADASVVDGGDAGKPGVDAGRIDVDSGCQCDGSYPFGVTTMDIADVNPPKDNTQGACTDAELAMLKGKFADILASVSTACASCLFTEANDTKNTQFFVWADTMHVNVSLQNHGACMASPLSGGNIDCGKAGEELFSCLETACPLPTDCCLSKTDCIDGALQGDCKQFDQKQTASCGGSAKLKSIRDTCFAPESGVDPRFDADITPGIKLLCGGSGITDGGGG